MTTIYVKQDGTRCVQCDAVKRWLNANNVPYEEKNALDHMDYLGSIGIRQMPIVVTKEGEAFGGFDIGKLQQIAGGS